MGRAVFGMPNLWGSARFRGDEFAGEQVHQQPVVRAAVPAALVVAHHAHRAEPEAPVEADRGLVVRGRVDGEAVVAVHLQQMAGQGGDGVRTDAAPVPARVNGDVETSVPVVGRGLLAGLDDADDRALVLNGVTADVLRRRAGLLGLLVGVAPPAGDFRAAEDLAEAREVRLPGGAQTHTSSRHHLHGSLRWLGCAASVGQVALCDHPAGGYPDEVLTWHAVAVPVLLRPVGAHVAAADAGRGWPHLVEVADELGGP